MKDYMEEEKEIKTGYGIKIGEDWYSVTSYVPPYKIIECWNLDDDGNPVDWVKYVGDVDCIFNGHKISWRKIC